MRYSSLTQCGFSMASFLQVEGYRLEPCGIAVNSLVSVASWMCRGVLPLVLALRQRQNAKAGTTVVDVTVWSSHFHAQTLAFIEHSPLSFTASHVAIPSIQTLVSQNFRNHFFWKSNSQCGKPSKAPGNCPKSIQIHWSYVNGKKSSRLQQLFCPHRAGRWLIKSGSHNGAVDFVDQWRIPEKDWMDGHYSGDEWSK